MICELLFQQDCTTYTDILIVCGTPEFLDNVFDTLLNPVIIIEILSDSTKQIRPHNKIRPLPLYTEFERIYNYFARIERYVRVEDNNVPPERTLWAFQAESTINETIELTTIDCALDLTEVYEDVVLKEPSSRPQ